MDNDFAWSLLHHLIEESQHPSWTANEVAELEALHEARRPFWEQLELEDIKAMREASPSVKPTFVREDKLNLSSSDRHIWPF